MINFLDTSAVLNGAYNLFNNVYISPLVITELENIKTNSLNEHKQYLARQAVRDIMFSSSIVKPCVSQKRVNKLLKHYDFLSDINDHKLLCEAAILAEEEQLKFITSDGAQYLFAQHIPNLNPFFFEDQNEQNNIIDYCGWGKYYPNDIELASLYAHPENNILNAKINEYCEIFIDDELKDILIWDGNHYRNLKYKTFHSILGEKIEPRNLEQKFYFDLLQNKQIPIKLCIARFGAGKSLIALNYALNEVANGRFEKIVFVKNNLEVKGAGKLGTLPGNEIDKQMPWLRQIEDHIGKETFEQMIDNGQIEPAHLSSLRGRDIKNSIILVDEAENLLTSNIQLLLGRVAANSEIIFCADIKQCDYKNQNMSGIPKLIQCLAGHPLFGMVKLIKAERSVIAETADLLD